MRNDGASQPCGAIRHGIAGGKYVRRRITISVDADIDDMTAVVRVKSVMAMGRISRDNTQYCYATTFADGIIVYADKTRAGNDTFVVGVDPSV